MLKQFQRNLYLILIIVWFNQCQSQPQFTSVSHEYQKHVYQIPMRDGIKLYTSVYTPRNTSQAYPIMLNRTPYGSKPYGSATYKRRLGNSFAMMQEKYIFVYQDVRGKYMSEGKYVNVRPYIENKISVEDFDESSDCYDTIEWLLANIENHNGKVGMWGISYPGFYTTMGLIDAHPALKAASPQAPIADWFIGDDMHHNGAFSLNLAFNFFASFGQPRTELTTTGFPRFKHGTSSGYDFFLNLGALPNANKKYFKNEIPFWNDLMRHGTYDDFWQSRSTLPHLKKIQPAVLIVGGWFDAEDLYGALKTHLSVSQKNPQNVNHLVMGPWGHGGWSRTTGEYLGDIWFGGPTSPYYQEEIELAFFNYHLKGKGSADLKNIYCFDTGSHKWHTFDTWPAESFTPSSLFLSDQNEISIGRREQSSLNDYDEYVSDPANPVPFTAKQTTHWGKTFMTEDQRFVAERPDVLVYRTDPLQEDITLAGPIEASLFVSTSGSDCDWVVKLIDEFPDDFSYPETVFSADSMGGYQMLMRAEIMRSKFRKSFEKPVPMPANEITSVRFKLQDVLHTFKTGHRIMIQIQSSWFPLFDRNPQQFLDIYSARDADFRKATQRIYHTDQYPSQLKVLKW